MGGDFGVEGSLVRIEKEITIIRENIAGLETCVSGLVDNIRNELQRAFLSGQMGNFSTLLDKTVETRVSQLREELKKSSLDELKQFINEEVEKVVEAELNSKMDKMLTILQRGTRTRSPPNKLRWFSLFASED